MQLSKDMQYSLTSTPRATHSSISIETWRTLTEKACRITCVDTGCSSNTISNSWAFIYGCAKREGEGEGVKEGGKERVIEGEGEGGKERVKMSSIHCPMQINYWHKLLDRLENKRCSSRAFHRLYHKKLSSFRHCLLAPHSMQISAVCGMCAWLFGDEI